MSDGPDAELGTRPPRCWRCVMHLKRCICDLYPKLVTQTRVVVVMHHAERNKTTNSGRLVGLALTHGSMRVRGLKDLPMDTEGMQDPARRTWLLFPDEDAVPLTPELVEGDPRPITLVVPDGNWRQARKVARREASLANATHIALPPGPPSRYQLRTHPDPTRVSTLEAIARALGIIEGPEAQDRLEAWFDTFVSRTRQSQGARTR